MASAGLTCGGSWWGRETYLGIERLGFDSLWTGEHIVYHRPILDAVPVVAALAALTTTIRIGPAAILVPLRHPTLLAKELASIDVISGGRLIVTAAAGGDYPKEFEACEIPISERGRRTTEALEMMRRYWSGERFSYQGRHFHAEDVWLDPPPAAAPPIWVAGRSGAALERAAA